MLTLTLAFSLFLFLARRDVGGCGEVLQTSPQDLTRARADLAD